MIVLVPDHCLSFSLLMGATHGFLGPANRHRLTDLLENVFVKHYAPKYMHDPKGE